MARLRVLGVLALTTALITFFGSVAQAAPAPSRDVAYTLTSTANSVELGLKNGSAAVVPGALSVRNDAGTEVFRLPLRYRMEYREFPIDARVAGKQISLIPSRDAARSHPVPAIEVDPLRVMVAANNGPTTKQQRDDQALARFNQQFSAGMSISALVGLSIGAVVGGIVGGVVGGTACLPLAIGALGCVLAGVSVGAGLGSIAGTIIGGGGSAIVAGIQYFQTINSPFVPPK